MSKFRERFRFIKSFPHRFNVMNHQVLDSHRLLNEIVHANESPVFQRALEGISWFAWTGVSEIPAIPGKIAFSPGTIKQRDVLSSDYLWGAAELETYPCVSREQWVNVSLVRHVWNHFGTLQTKTSKTALFIGEFESDLIDSFSKRGWKLTVLPALGFDVNGVALESIEAEFDLVSIRLPNHTGKKGWRVQSLAEVSSLLKKGGVCVSFSTVGHAIDANLVAEGDFNLHRIRDLSALLEQLTHTGMQVPDHDFEIGSGVLDEMVDHAPYRFQSYLRYEINGHVATPVSIVFSKPS